MTQTTSTYSPQNILTNILWVGVIAVAVFFIFRNALPYFGMDPEVFGNYWPHRFALIGHVGGGVLALTLGPLQFSKRFRNKYLSIHRIIGKVYVAAILIGAICALNLAFTVAMELHWTWAWSLIGLAFPWIICVLMAFRSIKLRRINTHREWMIRSYIVTFGFVLFRILDDFVLNEVGTFVERAPTEAWMVWAIPLFIGEVFLQWNKKA
jgi:uncharacterized membrane protein